MRMLCVQNGAPRFAFGITRLGDPHSHAENAHEGDPPLWSSEVPKSNSKLTHSHRRCSLVAEDVHSSAWCKVEDACLAERLAWFFPHHCEAIVAEGWLAKQQLLLMQPDDSRIILVCHLLLVNLWAPCPTSVWWVWSGIKLREQAASFVSLAVGHAPASENWGPHIARSLLHAFSSKGGLKSHSPEWMYIYIYGGGLVFCLPFFLFERQNSIFWPFWGKKGKGKEQKARPNLVVLSSVEKCTFSPVLSKI